jgi:TolA-binding protein
VTRAIIRDLLWLRFAPPPGQQVVRATRILSLALAVFAALAGLGRAQTNDIPVAQPASPSPDQSAPPVAQPAFPAPPAPDAATNAAPTPPGALVITTPAEAQFANAMTAYTAGRYADAVTAFSSFIANFPQDRRREEALYRLAESYRSLKRTDDALAAYTFEVQNYPDGPLRVNADLRRGAILFDEQKYSDAIAPLQFVAEKGDGDLQLAAKYLLGRTLLATQNEAGGRALLEGMADAQPPTRFSGNAAQDLAELDDSQNKHADALPLWQKALAVATDPVVKATAAARGGWSALQSKQPGEAEKLFKTARELDSNGEPRKVANTGLLRILFQQERYADWVEIYAKEKDQLLDSAREETLYDHGQAEFRLKHWKQAVAAFDAYLLAYGMGDAAITAAYERFLADTQIDPARVPAEGDAYLKTWPKSPYRAKVQLLQAQELSREKKFADALPLWESLAHDPDTTLPHQDVLFEWARAYDETGNAPKAATAYRAFLDDAGAHPGVPAKQLLGAQARLALSLQNSNQLLAATEAWNALLAQAPAGAPEEETALESLGLIYAKGGPAQEGAMVEVFRKLLDHFPQTPLRALASFTVGDALFKHRDYAGSERYLLNARSWDAKTWLQPATQRLVLGAYGQKNYDMTVAYLKEYDAIPAPANPQAAAAARLPAALFYWLGDTARKAGKLDDAETCYLRVVRHPDPGDLLAGAWWQLGEVQSQRKEWAAAVSSYENYRGLKPDAKDATTVLLALGRAQLGAGNFDAAKKIAEQALLQEPEGPHSAAARMLLGETAFAAGNFPEAAKQFALLATLFDDPQLTPQAEARAADAFDRAGDAKSAAEWRQKLKDKFPQFQPASYL